MQKEIIEVDGSTDKATIAKFVESMPIADSKYVRQFLKNVEPQIDLSKTVTEAKENSNPKKLIKFV
jgi:hypothetical protein